MKNTTIEKYIGTIDLSLAEAMKRIDLNSVGMLFIVDGDSRLVGCLTDGDIRRWIIKTGNLNANAGQAMNPNPQYVLCSDVDKSNRIMEDEQIFAVAVVNEEHQIQNIVFRESYLEIKEKKKSSTLQGVPIVVMAGGKGTRLYPYTKILPKPLIPIAGIPILERILDDFHRYGAQKFYITLNYRKEMIKSYFSEIQPEYEISFVEEEKPMGTAGGIRLIPEHFDRPVIVTNCDILIRTDYDQILQHHDSSENDMTIVSSLKNLTLSYGVLHTKENGVITSMEEKPSLSCFINTGMYIVNPECFERIPEGRVFHMTDLADKLLREGKKVGMYPISEDSFLDMGEFEEMKRMEERIEYGQIGQAKGGNYAVL